MSSQWPESFWKWTTATCWVLAYKIIFLKSWWLSGSRFASLAQGAKNHCDLCIALKDRTSKQKLNCLNYIVTRWKQTYGRGVQQTIRNGFRIYLFFLTCPCMHRWCNYSVWILSCRSHTTYKYVVIVFIFPRSQFLPLNSMELTFTHDHPYPRCLLHHPHSL